MTQIVSNIQYETDPVTGQVILKGKMWSLEASTIIKTNADLFYVWIAYHGIESAANWYVDNWSAMAMDYGVTLNDIREYILNDSKSPLTTEDKVYLAAVEINK